MYIYLYVCACWYNYFSIYFFYIFIKRNCNSNVMERRRGFVENELLQFVNLYDN